MRPSHRRPRSPRRSAGARRPRPARTRRDTRRPPPPATPRRARIGNGGAGIKERAPLVEIAGFVPRVPAVAQVLDVAASRPRPRSAGLEPVELVYPAAGDERPARAVGPDVVDPEEPDAPVDGVHLEARVGARPAPPAVERGLAEREAEAEHRADGTPPEPEGDEDRHGKPVPAEPAQAV